MLVPEDAARSALGGFLRVGGTEFRVRVRGVRYAPGDGRVLLDAAELEAEPPLAALLRPHAGSLRVRLAQSTSLDGFLRELEELVAVSQRSAAAGGTRERLEMAAASQLPSAEHYTRLLDELDAVGWRHVAHLSDDLRSLELRAVDPAQRAHCVRVVLPDDYGARRRRERLPGQRASKRRLECFVDAPEPFQVTTDTVASSTSDVNLLALVLRQFEAFLGRFQGFWDVLDDLDASTCVLEPHHPTRATGRRRMALEKHVSIQIEVDPARPAAMCELTFFGNDAAIAPLRERWSSSLFQWDDALPVRENLALVLGVSFPSPSERTMDEFAIECGICYSYRLELDAVADSSSSTANASKEPPRTVIPDRLCENQNCSRPFHEKCLFDWLKALPTARQSFHTVFGECPYCRETISAKFMV
jgi:E3 ubiquitin-protein ligase FANCL